MGRRGAAGACSCKKASKQRKSKGARAKAIPHRFFCLFFPSVCALCSKLFRVFVWGGLKGALSKLIVRRPRFVCVSCSLSASLSLCSPLLVVFLNLSFHYALFINHGGAARRSEGLCPANSCFHPDARPHAASPLSLLLSPLSLFFESHRIHRKPTVVPVLPVSHPLQITPYGKKRRSIQPDPVVLLWLLIHNPPTQPPN